MSELAWLFPVLLIAMALVAAGGTRRRRRIGRPARMSGRHGTVYVFQDRRDPGLVKIGYTARLSLQRKVEVARTMAKGSSLRQIFAVDTAHARTIETELHRRLGPWRDAARGREWYRVADQAELERLLDAVLGVALLVRGKSRRKNQWSPEDERRARCWRLTSEGPVRFRLGS